MRRGGFRRGGGGGDDRTGQLFGPTVAETRDRLLDKAQAGVGQRCPCCDHWVQFYRRRFGTTMALDVIWLARKHRLKPGEFVRVKHRTLYGREYAADTSDLGKLRYWGLAERQANDDETKRHSGCWRITRDGLELARDLRVVREYAVVYLDEVYGFEGGSIGLVDALKRPFNYRQLMNYDAQWWDA